MPRQYHLDPGYVTIPEAANIVKRMLGIFKEEERSHYEFILRGVKKGWFGGKMHGKRMFQARRKDIIQFGEELLEDEKYNLFNLDLETELQKGDRSRYHYSIHEG